jgi:hypothetical protein
VDQDRDADKAGCQRGESKHEQPDGRAAATTAAGISKRRQHRLGSWIVRALAAAIVAFRLAAERVEDQAH